MPAPDTNAPVHALLHGLIDYAGLFPPAKLDMRTTVENYSRDLVAPHAWMIGRLIVPVTRLDEFDQAASDILPADDTPQWRISALLPPVAELDTSTGPRRGLINALERIDAFNEAHASDAPGGAGAAVIDSVEIRTDTPAHIDAVLAVLPEEKRAFFEVPIKDDPRGLVAAIAGTGSAAKVRTGGVTPDAFPASAQLAAFLCACAKADVPFKATAGLHHPVRSERPLTYEAEAPVGTMHGFLNVFLGAAFAFAEGCTVPAIESVLEERSAHAFVFDAGGVKWRQNHLTTAQLTAARANFALSFGSCSVDEPVADLKELRLL
jgi:hypothetical protein